MRGPNKVKTPRAQLLRREAPPAERKLWSCLQNRQLNNAKFIRQHPIGPYYADFVCRAAKLIIEIDGPTHVGREGYDAQRTVFLESLGYRVIRFTNEQMYGEVDHILEEIKRHL
jgi:very-short-patch-repair endonuclease